MTRTVLLGDVVELEQGLAINAKTNHLIKPDGDLPLLRITDLLNDKQTQFIDSRLVPKQTIAMPHDIIYTRTGQVGCVFMGKSGVVHNNCFKVIVKDDTLLPRYLYWFLKLPQTVDYMLNVASGSVQKDLGHSAFKSARMTIPSLDQQRFVINICDSIDEKIELNRKMNETLEQMGRALFRHYFINNPEVEKWEEVKISDLIDFVGGSQPPKSEHIYDDQEGYIRFVQNRDYSSSSHQTYIPIAKRNKLCNETDIMMDKYGEAGRVRFGIAGAYNVALAKIVPKEDDMQEYLRAYFSLPQIQQTLEGAAAASTRSSVNATTFSGLKIRMPAPSLLASYEKTQKAVITQILLSRKQIQTLTTLRDTLLPRLINGKVKV